MRKIKIEKWNAKSKEGMDTEESLINVFSALTAIKKPDEMPRGIEKFRLFNKINKAFEKAETTGILELEETTYKFLKDMIETDVLGIWGTNPSISKAIESFMEAKEE